MIGLDRLDLRVLRNYCWDVVDSDTGKAFKKMSRLNRSMEDNDRRQTNWLHEFGKFIPDDRNAKGSFVVKVKRWRRQVVLVRILEVVKKASLVDTEKLEIDVNETTRRVEDSR